MDISNRDEGMVPFNFLKGIFIFLGRFHISKENSRLVITSSGAGIRAIARAEFLHISVKNSLIGSE